MDCCEKSQFQESRPRVHAATTLTKKGESQMRKHVFVFAIVAAMVMLLSGQLAAQTQGSAPAQETAPSQETTTVQEPSNLQVEVGAICKNVMDRAPVEAGSSFPASVGKLFCFTKITGALDPTHVTHVWSFDGSEPGWNSRSTLPVGAPTAQRISRVTRWVPGVLRWLIRRVMFYRP